jgi:pSer/pThr/pTyr-binding forkhead associated (FHA) protein
MLRLRFVTGPLAGREVEVTSVLVLGRQATDLVIDDPQVSRRHASVRPAAGGLEVEDHGSRNGTWVNGARVGGPTRLVPGDRVRLGETTLEVEGAATATAAAPTEASPQPAPPPARPFDPPPQRAPRRRRVASRRLTPTLLSFGTVIATAIALVWYFATR